MSSIEEARVVEDVEEVGGGDEQVRHTDGISLFYPIVEESKKPHVGMIFSSLEESENFYTEYAKLGGFGSRKFTTKFRGNEHELYSRDCCCTKQGGKDPTKEVKLMGAETSKAAKVAKVTKAANVKNKKKRNRLSRRTFCKAFVRFHKVKGTSNWKVIKFEEGHNHVLYTPSKTHLIRQYRGVSDAQKNLLSDFSEVNVPTGKAYTYLAMQSGGLEHVGCTEKDFRNHEARTRDEKKDYDAQILVDYFRGKHETNPSFYYAIEVDEENRLKHCFWSDEYARKAYAHFGDVVVFDTTYDTNQYHLIFAPFTGINHHRQSVCFGWALLKDEKIESFVWLFMKFLEAMSGLAPKVMITDQDPAMKNAIARVFPGAFHRLCMWHILQKLPDKIRSLAHDRDFCTRLSSCAYFSETPEIFEQKWGQITSEFNVSNDKWLIDIFGIRERWIPAYFKDIFMANVHTTQRSESLNSFFDKYVNKRHTLGDFIIHFRLAMKKQRYNEFQANFDNVNGRPPMKTEFSNIEEHMAEIYTLANFYIIQEELLQCVKYGARFDDRSGDVDTYTVEKLDDCQTESSRKVMYNKSSECFNCACKKFETEGIPCRHILITMRGLLKRILPEHLILKRWTKKANADIVCDNHGIELGPDAHDPEIHRSKDELSTKWGAFHRKACSSKETLQVANVVMDEMMSAFHSKCAILGLDMCGGSNKRVTIPSQVDVHPRERSKTKGSGKRIKGWKEIATKKTKKPKRLCKGCNQYVHHDRRNCPKVKGIITTSSSRSFDEDDLVDDLEDGGDDPEDYSDFDGDEEEISLTGPSLANSFSQP